jgi:hypothetical protein
MLCYVIAKLTARQQLFLSCDYSTNGREKESRAWWGKLANF